MGSLSENARHSIMPISPELGAFGGYFDMLITLPVEPTKPIDAGLFNFCRSCHKCANNCVPGVISQANEPSWEIPAIQGMPNVMHNPGTKEFWSDGALCRMWRTEYGTSCNQCW